MTPMEEKLFSSKNQYISRGVPHCGTSWEERTLLRRRVLVMVKQPAIFKDSLNLKNVNILKLVYVKEFTYSHFSNTLEFFFLVVSLILWQGAYWPKFICNIHIGRPHWFSGIHYYVDCWTKYDTKQFGFPTYLIWL